MNENNNDDLEDLIRDFRTLPPEQRDRLVRRVIARAKAHRAQAIRDVFRRLYDWIRRRAAIARLHRLDDRMLKDIGLSRGEIESAVRGFPRDRSVIGRGSVPSCQAKRTTARAADKAA